MRLKDAPLLLPGRRIRIILEGRIDAHGEVPVLVCEDNSRWRIDILPQSANVEPVDWQL